MYKVETYKLTDWEDSESGLLITENDNWILVKHIPVDYVIDGYRLYKKGFIEKRERTKKEKQIEKVLELKEIGIEQPDNFQFSDTLGVLKWCEKEYGFFEFQEDDETELFYGKIREIKNNLLTIDMIKANGAIEPDYDYEYNIDEIRVITFQTDYFISIGLLMRDKQNK